MQVLRFELKSYRVNQIHRQAIERISTLYTYMLYPQIGKCHYFLSFTKEIHQEEKSMSYTIRIPIKFCNQQMHFFCVLRKQIQLCSPYDYMSGLVSYVILLVSSGSSTTVYNFNNFDRISMLWGAMYIWVFILCY